ncbi:hypothetical protein BX070DRAFT_252592 [Coemansia spiralis]|nr:hypothetical protein BX070DRAFT_252592 [Coemansia spiralis]
MATDADFFNTTLAQLSKLTSSVRTFAADTKVPDGIRYPPKNYDFKMPAIQTTSLAPEDREDYFTLTFKTLKPPVRKFTVHASSVRTVTQVKRHLSKISNIPVNSMRLVLNGKGLVDSKLIGDYAIQDDSVIQIISKPSGSPLPEAENLSLAGSAADAADISNPLSSVLDKETGGFEEGVISARIKKAKAGLPDASEYTSDASSDGESAQIISQQTKAQLQQKNSAFRNSLRELVHSQFGSSQAGNVDRLLNDYFESL